jgi:hypothetical protein
MADLGNPLQKEEDRRWCKDEALQGFLANASIELKKGEKDRLCWCTATVEVDVVDDEGEEERKGAVT